MKRYQKRKAQDGCGPPLEQTNPWRLQTVKDHTAWLKILKQVTNTWIITALKYLCVYVRYIQVQPGLIGGLWNQMGIKPPCDPVYIEVNRVQGRLTPLGTKSYFLDICQDLPDGPKKMQRHESARAK